MYLLGDDTEKKGWTTYPKSTIEKVKKKSQEYRLKQQLHNTLKKEDRREPGGLAGIQKRIFRDKRYELTLNHEGEQVEKTDRWKGYQMKSKARLFRCNQNIG